MIKGWLLERMRGRALAAGAREVAQFVEGLAAIGDADMGVLLAVAAVIRVNMETHGVLPEGVFTEGPLPDAEALGTYQLSINRLARQFRRMGNATDSAAAMVWSYSLRCLNVPELRPLGRRLWGELARGVPHAKAALAQGEREKGEALPPRVWREWRLVPVGLEPASPPWPRDEAGEEGEG